MCNKVLIFGAGKLYSERISYIERMCEVVGIIDNNSMNIKENEYNYPVYDPSIISNIKDCKIILLSDSLCSMILQIQSIVGIDECCRRIKIGRFFSPITCEEEMIAKEKYIIEITNDKVFFSLMSGEKIQLFDSAIYIKEIYRIVSKKNNSLIRELIDMPLIPVDDSFGRRRGEPIDRIYIDDFLKKNKEYIRGKCLEISEDTYTKKYGEDRVNEACVLHVEGWGENVVKGNLETGEGIEENTFDSMIITQTLMFIYDVDNSIKTIYKSLKDNGTVLITVSGISKIARYDEDNWGMYHSFYLSALKKLLYPVFGEQNVEIIHYGNVKTAIGFLYGLAAEDLAERDFDFNDKDYPVIYGIRARKILDYEKI